MIFAQNPNEFRKNISANDFLLFQYNNNNHNYRIGLSPVGASCGYYWDPHAASFYRLFLFTDGGTCTPSVQRSNW